MINNNNTFIENIIKMLIKKNLSYTRIINITLRNEVRYLDEETR